MAKQYKKRRICSEAPYRAFAPAEDVEDEEIVMTMDEYETVRLIDLENLSQEQCAQRMGIARTTAQAIYNSARSKQARFLVKGTRLRIEGGNYNLCEGDNPECGICRRTGDADG